MSKNLLRFSRWLVVGALFLAIGGHWALLQTMAWASMIVDYSRTEALTVAVEKTFDGQHPCAICNVIQKGRHSEKKHEAVQLIKKIELFAHRGTEFIYPSVNSSPGVTSGFFGEARVEAPLVPPPRVA
jgi:hypothetical protein